MDFRCLSAAGLRFLRHAIPTREFCVPCGSLTGHRPDSVGLTTFRNSRRCDWFRRPLCCVSIGYPQPSTGELRFPTQALGYQPLPKPSLTQLQPRIHFRSPFQPFPGPDAPFGLGQSLGFYLVLSHPAVTSSACKAWEQMGYSSVVFRRTPFLQHRVARPDGNRTNEKSPMSLLTPGLWGVSVGCGQVSHAREVPGQTTGRVIGQSPCISLFAGGT